ncbi:hypothetical protein AAHH78_38980, partial [Burkholderia pseudomallei]
MNDMTQPSVRAAETADAPNDRSGVNKLRDELVESGLLISTGIQGLFGRSERLERVVDAHHANITRLGAEQQA